METTQMTLSGSQGSVLVNDATGYETALIPLTGPCQFDILRPALPGMDGMHINPLLRRDFMTLLGGAALLAPLPLRAQTRSIRIGYLANLAPEATPDLLSGFRDTLRARGYVEGENLTIVSRFGPQLSETTVRELIDQRPDIIVAWATPAVTIAQRATHTIPIVMVGIADPVASGFVASLSRPGGNITGTTNLSRDLGGKLMELLIEVVPGLYSIAVLRNPSNPAARVQFGEVEAAARVLHRPIVPIDISSDVEMDDVFGRIKRDNARAAVALADPYFISRAARIADLAKSARLPIIFSRRENVEAGGLLSYGPSLREQFRATAIFVDKILRGAAPADLPVEQPTKFELLINLKTAKALGLDVPPTLLARADEVIE
jgi:putative ABC transport system substrate-binding protein